MQAICSFLGYTQSQPNPIIIDGKRSPIVESFAALILDASFESTNLQVVDTARRVFKMHRLPEDHPAQRKINDIIAQSPLHALQKTDQAYLDGVRSKICVPAPVPSSTIFVQNNLTIPQLQALIQAQGAGWQELVLNNVDDDTMGMIVANCKQLTTLRIIDSASQLPLQFNPLGLQCIAAIPTLKTLELNLWYSCISIASNDIQELLTQPSLQKNLTSLTVVSSLLTDDNLKAIAQYTNLESLSVQFLNRVTSQGVNALAQSASLKNTLVSINIFGYDILFNGYVLNGFAGFPKLIEVTFNGGWDITDPYLLSFLRVKNNLQVLGISGYPIPQSAIDQLATSSSLRNLALGDCSKVSSFNNLTQKQTQLKTLLLDKAQNFTWIDLSNLSKYQNLTSLSLLNTNCLDESFEAFCKSPTIVKSLQYLLLAGANTVTSTLHLGALGNLGALTTLRLQNVAYFNDDSMKLMLSYTPLIASLEALELNAVSIDNESIKRLSALKKLNTLMLARCFSVTEKGMRSFLGNTTLQASLIKLYLDGVTLNKEILKDFNNFANLQIFYLCDLQKPSLNCKEVNQMWKLPNFVKNNTNFSLLGGSPLVSFATFLRGQWINP